MKEVSGRLLVLAVAAAIGSLFACLPVGSASTPARTAAGSVKVGNNFLSPTGKTIGRGGSASWVWAGGRKHHLVGKSGGRVIFSSRSTSRRGYAFRHRFGSKGRYSVICTIHPDSMRMTIAPTPRSSPLSCMGNCRGYCCS